MRSGRVVLAFGSLNVPVDVAWVSDQAKVRALDREMTLSVQPLGSGVYAITCDGRRFVAHHARDGEAHHLHVGGETYGFEHVAADATAQDSAGGRRPASPVGHHDFRAPMPGVVTQIFVAEGRTVEAGAPLYVVESMKIENVIRAPTACLIVRVLLAPGARVEGGAMVVEIEEAGASSDS